MRRALDSPSHRPFGVAGSSRLAFLYLPLCSSPWLAYCTLYGYLSDDRTSELSCHVIVNGVPMIRRLLSDAQELVEKVVPGYHGRSQLSL